MTIDKYIKIQLFLPVLGHAGDMEAEFNTSRIVGVTKYQMIFKACCW
jgi:hypothetical protein